MTIPLFGRRCDLTLARPQAGKFNAQEQNATIIRDLRVRFEIEKSLEKEPNTCNLIISNLAPESRAAFTKKPLHVRLDAGYESEGLRRLFTGDLIWGWSTKPEDTWLTEIDVADGGRAYRHARASRTFKAGTSIETVVKDLAGTMGLEIPKSIKGAKGFIKQFSTGVTVEGPSRLEMDRMMKMAGVNWSMQNSRLQVLGKGEHNQIAAILVSPDTGLLGVPEFGPPKDPKERPVLTFKTRLDGRLDPGAPVKFESRDVNGLFVIRKVKHDGDTHGPEWYSSCEALPYG